MYRRKVIFWAACTGMLFFGVCLITLGSIVPDLSQKLALDALSAGTLFSILPFGILTGSLLFGPVVDRYGYKILLAASCAFLFAGFEGIAFGLSAGLIKIFVFMVGFGGGAINGATNALVSDISDSHKGADLSLLGVFFGIGALGMPLILGLLKNTLSFEVILAVVGMITIAAGIFFLVIKFPPPKQSQGFPISQSIRLVKDKVLIFIGIFLFFQSSFEGIINNWTTSYLINHLEIREDFALYALSSFVAGMTLMRLITGSIFRKMSGSRLLFTCFALSLAGLIIIKSAGGFYLAASGLFLLGAGLSAGFPVMLGFTGDRYSSISGTAFSLVLAFALIGNMLINYAMGLIARNFGIRYLTTVAFAELIILILMAIIILNLIRNKK
jgi:FHS family glucose/mannose:H+ symporter-like MFS transporter